MNSRTATRSEPRSRAHHARRALATGTLVFASVTLLLVLPLLPGGGSATPQEPPTLRQQTQRQVEAKSSGCMVCHLHENDDKRSMHANEQPIGCTDCHGGDAGISTDAAPGSKAFDRAREAAHVAPRLDIWTSSANPVRASQDTLQESAKFIRFVNPGDFRVVDQTCGVVGCHPQAAAAAKTSMMTHGAMLYGAALYNNGALPTKDSIVGELYMPDGSPATVRMDPAPSAEETAERGILPFLVPLPRWEISQPGNVFRTFERGGVMPAETGLPNPSLEPGRPKSTLSNRGFGTLNRTDPVVIAAQKTRLMDPTLNTIGTNDRAGDYRSSGCTACHVIYANDRSPVHSGSYAAYGNAGESHSSDSTIPRNESGHPVQHRLTSAIPTSQCMVCHMHPGTNMMTTYLGFTWWDNETDGDKMYPAATRKISAAERAAIEIANPEGSAVRGLWSDRDFLQQTGTKEFNLGLEQTVFADFHGHGWMYRAVFKRDRKGNLLNEQGGAVQGVTPQMLWDAVMHRDTGFEREPLPDDAPVHLKDIHLERGMHCVDCHLQQDAHGNGKLYGEPRNMIEITCEDCHGSINERATLVTSGPGAPPGGTDLQATGRFSRDGDSILLTSALDPSVEWEIPQIVDSLDPDSPRFNQQAAYAKTLQKDGETWGGAAPPDVLAHADTNMTCASCHTSWMTSCFGCHLAQRANEKQQNLHNEATDSRNWTQYNYQVLRDDVFMLAHDGSVIGGRISPARSSSAVIVSSQDRDRNWIYFQEQTVSAEGYSGQAFNTHVPHTVRRNETRGCDDCHVSSKGDNNAIMAQLLTLGTNLTNFMGRFVYVGTGHGGLEAIAVTEMDEPQAVIGSDLHRIAYPEEYAKHLKRKRQLTTSEHHGSKDAVSVQKRGEYVFIADGEGGLKVFDIAQINNKAFSEKIVSAPVSPIGQQTNVKTRHATAVALPSTLAIDPARQRLPANEEQPIHPLYSYAYVSDLREGLVVTTTNTLLDGNPTNNFLERVLAFNPDGRLDGAVNLTVAGTHVYVLTDDAMVVVDIDDPLHPHIVAEVTGKLHRPRAVAIQFRYAFVTDADGFKVIDVTDPATPRFVEDATVQLEDARGLYVARTYAYVAGGHQGLVILDVERPEQPRIDQVFDAGGAIDDAQDVKVAMTNASVFAYVADGHNGLRVLQLVSSNDTPGAFGFSPRPQPELIASYHTHGPALSISKGLDRDRAVDESGNQLVVFGRRGGRPFTLQEMQRLYLRNGKLWTVPSRQQR